jgi:hypothetical protein
MSACGACPSAAAPCRCSWRGTVCVAGAAAVLWLLSVSTTLLPHTLASVVAALPMYLLVSFGAYSLASVACSLIFFRDCPGAFHELQRVRLASPLLLVSHSAGLGFANRADYQS